MKKFLLLLMFTALSSSTFVNAQTKIWDFGNDTATWPLSSGIGNDPMVVDNLGLYPIPTNTNFGAVTANNLTFGDGFSATQRFQMNGGGYPAGEFQPMPTQRYLFFGVSGSCTIKVWFRTGSNGAVRTLYVSDGTQAVGSATTNANGNGDFPILETTYTGGATTLYIYGDTATNLYKVEVSGATVETSLGLNDLDALTTNVVAAGNKVFLQNVISSTEVNVYNMTGALVRNFTTSTDLDFELNQGLYIVNVKSDQGEKSVKVIMQ